MILHKGTKAYSNTKMISSTNCTGTTGDSCTEKMNLDTNLRGVSKFNSKINLYLM